MTQIVLSFYCLMLITFSSFIITEEVKFHVNEAPTVNTEYVLDGFLPYIYQCFQNNFIRELLLSPSFEAALSNKAAGELFDDMLHVFVDHLKQVGCNLHLFLLKQSSSNQVCGSFHLI